MVGLCIKIVEKILIFIASKEVGLTLKKSLKRLLQNIYLMLELLYHKHNPLIVTTVHGIFFFKKD